MMLFNLAPEILLKRRRQREWELRNPAKMSLKRESDRARYHRDLEDSREEGREKAKRRSHQMRQYARTWRESHPDKVQAMARRSNLRQFGGLTVHGYETMLAEQQGVCAICLGLEPVHGRRLAVDHDHATDAVRGLLCSHCNNGLGRFKDDPELLRSAMKYLEKHRK